MLLLVLAHRPSRSHAASDDMESQSKQWLSRDELMAALWQGRIGELKWAQTVSMALLYNGPESSVVSKLLHPE